MSRPSDHFVRILLAVSLMMQPLVASAQDAAPNGTNAPAEDGSGTEEPVEPETVGEIQPESSFWHSGYLVDYGLIALGAAGYLVGSQLNPRKAPLFGANFDITDPLGDSDERIGRVYLSEGPGGETVPTTHLIIMVPSLLAGLSILEGGYWAFSDDNGSAQRYHDTTIGFVESVMLTLGTTELLKAAVGRLRPDFGTRAGIAYCLDNPNADGCEGIEIPEGYTAEEFEDELLDGRKSFPSGHSSIGVNIFTYTALVLGGRYVWGNRATRLSRGIGLFLQTLALGSGVFIATSRLDDGRHHDTDVFSGMFLGFGMANVAYWRRFNGDGVLIPRKEKRSQDHIEVGVGPGPGEAGLSLKMRF